jgi:CBS domain-containing protein
MRSPLTGVVFAMELTHQWDALMPLIVSSTIAFLLSVLVLKRSVLTEKVVRKGTHLTREYSIDPLEIFLVGEIMPNSFLGLQSGISLAAAAQAAEATWTGNGRQKLAEIQRLYPIVDDDDHLIGVVTRQQLLSAGPRLDANSPANINDLMVTDVVVGYPDMTLRELANLMAERQVSSVPIVDRKNGRLVLGVMALDQVLEARLRDVNEEHKSERVIDWLQIRTLGGGRVLVQSQPDAEQNSDTEVH